jgi:hypothetical protein
MLDRGRLWVPDAGLASCRAAKMTYDRWPALSYWKLPIEGKERSEASGQSPRDVKLWPEPRNNFHVYPGRFRGRQIALQRDLSERHHEEAFGQEFSLIEKSDVFQTRERIGLHGIRLFRF